MKGELRSMNWEKVTRCEGKRLSNPRGKLRPMNLEKDSHPFCDGIRMLSTTVF